MLSGASDVNPRHDPEGSHYDSFENVGRATNTIDIYQGKWLHLGWV